MAKKLLVRQVLHIISWPQVPLQIIVAGQSFGESLVNSVWHKLLKDIVSIAIYKWNEVLILNEKNDN